MDVCVVCAFSSTERRSCHGGMMTAAGWVVAVDKLIETGQIKITNCDANFAVGTSRSASHLSTTPHKPSGVGTMGTGGTLYPQVQDLYPPSQRCGLCQNFKQMILTTRLYKVRTNLYPPLTKTFQRACANLHFSRFNLILANIERVRVSVWIHIVHYISAVILLVPSESPTPIFSPFHLSTHHLVLAVLALQPLKFGTLPLSLCTCTSPDTFRRHLKNHYCQQAFQSS